MPELPDITIYIEALESRVRGRVLESTTVASPFLVRTFDPPLEACHGRTVTELRRLGKRICLRLSAGKTQAGDDFWIILHLMIAGRLHWKPPDAALPKKVGLAAFRFANGLLTLTEAGSKRRASLHVVRGESALAAHDPGGLDPLTCTAEQFAAALRGENHTLKRRLTDPRTFSGIGNAYSDEILHAARVSPVKLTRSLSDDEAAQLHQVTRDCLRLWVERLRAQYGNEFPEGVTAFREDMAVHGKFGKPCPVCGSPVQRIRYADNETNYCPGCQTGGKILADRSLSRLLKDDWPRTLEELE
jgi:formamidopyrimidine-DNA glycosylase